MLDTEAEPEDAAFYLSFNISAIFSTAFELSIILRKSSFRLLYTALRTFVEYAPYPTRTPFVNVSNNLVMLSYIFFMCSVWETDSTPPTNDVNLSVAELNTFWMSYVLGSRICGIYHFFEEGAEEKDDSIAIVFCSRPIVVWIQISLPRSLPGSPLGQAKPKPRHRQCSLHYLHMARLPLGLQKQWRTCWDHSGTCGKSPL